MDLKPEEKVRKKIDEKLKELNWEVVDRNSFSSYCPCAIEEGLLKDKKEADYLLMLDGKIIGVIETKRGEDNLEMAKNQAINYTEIISNTYQVLEKPLPLIYISNGKKILFKYRNNDWKELNNFHTPKEIKREFLSNLPYFSCLPKLENKQLPNSKNVFRDCQFQAIKELELSFKSGNQKALIVMATGSGKTYTAKTIVDRFLSYTPMKRILFLVDRNNLGKQTKDEFSIFDPNLNSKSLSNKFSIEKLGNNEIDKSVNVYISTIQRLFSVLTKQEYNEEDEKDELNDYDDNIEEKIIEFDKNKTFIEKDFFDLIIIDECHRSIYGKWQSVLNYFENSYKIGLTATPSIETDKFFDNNKILNYTYEKSVEDGINVPYEIYRIERDIENKKEIELSKGQEVNQTTNWTGKNENIKLETEKNLKISQLNKTHFNEEDIRKTLEEFKNSIYRDLYSNREAKIEYIPKTLIFAENEKHCDLILKIGKEVFKEQNENFIQKITYSTDSNKLIKDFRNEKDFRIAITVTLVATGTDIKPLEIVMFMRDIKSDILYKQMIGRACRTIDSDVLLKVTPNAKSKENFYLIDTCGVTEHEKYKEEVGGNNNKILTLKYLLEEITKGNIQDAFIHNLAGKLSRINLNIEEKEILEFEKLANISLKELINNFNTALENETLPPFIDINNDNSERKKLVLPLSSNPEARKMLLELNAGKTLIYSNPIQINYSGFSKIDATKIKEEFEFYINENKNKIETLDNIYNNRLSLITNNSLVDLEDKLKKKNNKFLVHNLWKTYSILDIKTNKEIDNINIITNYIPLCKYGYKQIQELRSIKSTYNKNFELWAGSNKSYLKSPLTDEQKEYARKLAEKIAINGAISYDDLKSEKNFLQNIISSYGSKDVVKEMLPNLSNFILLTA